MTARADLRALAQAVRDYATLNDTRTPMGAYIAAASPDVVLALLDDLDAAREALRAAEPAIGNAIGVIEAHVALDALGQNGPPEAPWPLRDEYLHYMREAHTAARAALARLERAP